MTLKTPPLAAGRILKGARMRGGVCCHRGLSAASASYPGARDGVVVEKAHAEVRTRAGREEWAQRSSGAAGAIAAVVDGASPVGKALSVPGSLEPSSIGKS